MKKLVYTLIALMVLTVFMVGCTTVVPETDLSRKGPNGQAGNSNIAHLNLYQKTSDESDDWPTVPGGAWGKMKYNISGPEFDFVFNGHGLVPGDDYTLIYYPDPWPGNGLICLGSGIVNDEGNIHIAESVETGDLPAIGDENYTDGAKIFLVLSDDVDCVNNVMAGWTGACDGNHEGTNIYLFEDELITFDDTTV